MNVDPIKPDYTEAAISLLMLVRHATDDDAKRLIKAELGAAFAAGGLKALALVSEGMDKL